MSDTNVISGALRIFVMVVGASVFIFVFHSLVKKRLNESESVIWFLMAAVTLLIGIFPDIVNWVSMNIGIDYPPALLFLAAILLVLAMLFRLFSQMTVMNAQIKEISVIVSLLVSENEQQKAKIDELTGQNNDI